MIGSGKTRWDVEDSTKYFQKELVFASKLEASLFGIRWTGILVESSSCACWVEVDLQ